MNGRRSDPIEFVVHHRSSSFVRDNLRKAPPEDRGKGAQSAIANRPGPLIKEAGPEGRVKERI